MPPGSTSCISSNYSMCRKSYLWAWCSARMVIHLVSFLWVFFGLCNLFIFCHLLKPADTGLMVNVAETFRYWRVRDGRRRLLTLLEYGGWDREKSCSISLILRQRKLSICLFQDHEMIEQFGNASIWPEAVVHAWILAHSNSRLICTCSFASATTDIIIRDVGRIFISLATRTRRGAHSFNIIKTCVSYSPMISSRMCWMASIGTSLELKGTIFHSGGKTTYKILSMNKVLEKTGTTKLHTTPRTAFTLERLILTCSIIVSTTLAF